MLVVLPLSAGCGFGLALALTPLAAAFARRVGLLDKPDGRRKIHSRPVPLAGGLAIFLAVGIALAGVFLAAPIAGQWFSESRLSVWGLAGSAAILCLVGVLDDRRPLRGSYKLLGQLLAVCVLLASGVTVQFVDLFGLTVHLGLLAAPVTVFWLLGAINSLNLIDGMDGMGSCVGGAIAAAIAALSLLTDQFATALVALTLLGAITGFLAYNLPPARVYLGDCGSMIIGMLIGVLALQSALKGPTTVMLTIPIALFTLPIFDTAAAIARRKLTGRSIYTTDRGHLHHCLQRSGLSRQRVLVLVSFLCGLTGIGALASLALQRQLFAVISAITVTAALVLTRLFGHTELVLIRKQLIAFCSRLRYAHDGRRAVEMCAHLQGSADWRQLWEQFSDAAQHLGISSLCLDVNIPSIQERYHARWDRLGALPDDVQMWTFQVPLAWRGAFFGRIELHGPLDDVPIYEKISAFARIAEDAEQSISLMLEQAAVVEMQVTDLRGARSETMSGPVRTIEPI